MKLPTYKTYRESCVPWLAVIPDHWEETPVKMNYSIQLGKMLQNVPYIRTDEEIAYLKALHVNWDCVATEELPKMWASRIDFQTYGVENGDLLVCEGGEVGRACIIRDLDGPAIIQNALHRIRDTQRGSVRFLCYLLKHVADAGWFAVLCNKATIAHLTKEKLGSIYMPVPKVEEQNKIADFLDWKTGQIDELISKKKQLIEKLKEKRIALINQAVTKGLDPNVKMKDSGVEWLGEVPMHRVIIRFRYIFIFGRGLGITKSDLQDTGIPCISYGEIHSKYGFEVIPEKQELKCVSESYLDECSDALLKNGDFVFADTSEDIDGSGNFSYLNSNVPTFAGYHTIIAKPIAKVIPRYLAYLFDSVIFRYQIRRNVSGVKVFSITQNILKCNYVWIPSEDDQERIVNYLDYETNKIDDLISVSLKTIDKLQEYRTALITAATTGRIDVRNVKIGGAE